MVQELTMESNMRQDLQKSKYPLYIGITTLVLTVVVVLTSSFISGSVISAISRYVSGRGFSIQKS